MTGVGSEVKITAFSTFLGPNQIFVVTIDFYGQNYIYTPKFLVWVRKGVVLGVKNLDFWWFQLKLANLGRKCDNLRSQTIEIHISVYRLPSVVFKLFFQFYTERYIYFWGEKFGTYPDPENTYTGMSIYKVYEHNLTHFYQKSAKS